jgi:hypothetical protein
MLEVAKIQKAVDGLSRAEIRRRVVQLKDRVDESYFEMAGLLYRIYKEELYRAWGYNGFEPYVEAEMGFKGRKAWYLVGVYEHYCVKNKDHPEMIKAASDIGYEKAKELVGVATPENIGKFVTLAEKTNVIQFKEHVKKEAGVTPQVEEVFRSSFVLYRDQHQSVMEAIEMAKKMGETEKPSHALSLICLNFVATNIGKEKSASLVVPMLKRWEKQEELRFLVVNSKDKVVYKSRGLPE